MAASRPDLAAMVRELRYKTGWRFLLSDSPTTTAGPCSLMFPDGGQPSYGLSAVMTYPPRPLSLLICLTVEDTYRPGEMVPIGFWFGVPDDPGVPWHRWLLDCIQKVETHEMCEAFQVGSHRPFHPAHGWGEPLYEIIDHGLMPSWAEPAARSER